MATSTSTDSLMTGRGHTPDYGLESTEKSYLLHSIKNSLHSESEERWHVVARCALTACIASIVIGMSLSFSSIVINELSTDDNAYWIIKSDGFEASMIGALVPVGAIFGGFFSWPAADFLGRQASLIIGGVPALCGWLLISLSILLSNKTGFFAFLYIGRFITGFASGWLIYCVSVYIAEVASAKRKGLFGNCNQLFITIGVMFSYILGIKFKDIQISFYVVALVAAGIVVLFEVMMLFTYETPRWLFGKNKEYLGIRVLKLLRGPDSHIMKEIDHIKAAVRSYSIIEQFKEFQNRSIYHPFILVLMLMFFQQFSGINAAIFYSSTIFKDAGYKTNEVAIISALSVGVTQIIATFLSVLLIDRSGRRNLLVISSIGMCVSSLLLAVFFFVDSSHVMKCDSDAPDSGCSKLQYVAILAVVIFIASFSLGWGPIPWTAMSELLPNRVRGLAASITTAVNWSFATIITLCFDYYVKLVDKFGAWGTFSVVMFFSIICIVLFLPETKGRSLEEIEEHFERGSIFNVKFKHRGGRTNLPINSEVSE